MRIPIIFIVILILPGSMIAQIPTGGLVAYYPLNGNARDSSGNGNHGMVYDLEWVEDRFGNKKSAAYFDGVDDYIRIPFSSDFDFSDTKELSVGYWSDTLCAGLGRDTRNFGFGFMMGMDDNNTYKSQLSASFYWISIIYEKENDDKWHYYLLTADEKYLTFWVDSRLIERRSLYNAKWEKIRLQDFYVATGYNPHIYTFDFNEGILDDIHIYNKVLTPDEISIIYSGGKTTK
jgi:hypothetical protein